MADSKLSELTSAASVGVSDLFYVVQSNTSKKVTAAVLFENAANVTFKGNINYDSSIQTLSAPGTIDLKKQITHLSSDSNGGNVTITAGTTHQQKILVMISNNGGNFYINSNVAGSGNVVFDRVGDTATLLYTNNKWFVIGGTANVTY